MRFILNDSITKEEIYDLYQSVGWLAYLDTIDELMEGIQNSLYIETIRKDGTLIGLVRAVGDGRTIVYIQDILIHPEFQRQGLGRRLLGNIMTHYKGVRQKILLTDNSEKTKAFYQSIGGKDINDNQLSMFMFNS